MTRKPFFPILLTFFVIAFLLIIIMFAFHLKESVFQAMFWGNLVLYVATSLSFRFNQKGIGNKNIQAFLRMVYSGMFLKMGICIAAVMAYALLFKPISVAAILVFFVLYFVYTIIEVRILMRQNKGNKDA